MIEIDGSKGEGGGQILRSCVGLAAATGQAVRIRKIRGRRKRPGLLRQHLTAVVAAAKISGAKLRGAHLHSSELSFHPGPPRAGEYEFRIGTAGSATLVFQTVLPALLAARGPSAVAIEGGTHNPMAPPFEFLDRVFFPLLERMGVKIERRLLRPGFYPAGGGRIEFEIEANASLRPLEILTRGKRLGQRATAICACLNRNIAKRELKAIQSRLHWEDHDLKSEVREDSLCPGNAVLLEVRHEGCSELVMALGRRDLRAERVSAEAIQAIQNYLMHDAPVGVHLADQLLLPFALAGGGSFRTRSLSRHTTSNIEIIERFVDYRFVTTREEDGSDLIRVLPR